MPLALDPHETVPVSLALDADKPEESRPTFICRFVSSRDVIRIEELVAEAAAQGTSNKDVNAKLNEALALEVVDWKNMGAAFGPDCLDILTIEEKFELVGRALSAASVDFFRRRRLLLQSPSATAKSAPNASPNAAATSQPATATTSTSPA